MDIITARKVLGASKAEGYTHISITAPFMFNGGERVKCIHLVTPKSGDWTVSDGTAIRSEWIGRSMGYMVHVIMLDSGETVRISRGDVFYSTRPQMSAQTLEWTVTAGTYEAETFTGEGDSYREFTETRPALFLAAQGDHGVTVSVRYTGVHDWEYTVTDAYGDGEGSGQSPEFPHTPRDLQYVLSRAADAVEEMEEESGEYPDWQDDYTDGWDDFDTPDYPSYYEAYGYESDLMNEY